MNPTLCGWIRRAATLGAMALMCGAAWAGFPERPLTLVVPYPPGGATDSVGRLLAKALGEQLHQTAVVENKAGAGTVIGAGMVAHAAPDGYTLLISSNTTFTVNPALRANLPYDPLKSFQSIGLIGSSPLVLLANPSLPVKSVQELVALAKAKPGQLSFGSFGIGTTAHFAGAMFKAMADVDLLHVPFKCSAPAMQALIADQIDLSFDTTVAAAPQMRAGKVKALAVTSATRAPAMPEVPTIAESGYPSYEMVPWITVVAPSGLPDAVAHTLDAALKSVLATPATHEALGRLGVDVDYEPPSAYAAKIEKELPLLRAYAQKANIQVQ
jgi:tripartite-type tricarboxylate transporter receptor subunit TctC